MSQQFLRCFLFLFLVAFAGSVALAKPSPRKNDPLNPAIPSAVPQSGESFSNRKTELERNLIRKGSSGKRKSKVGRSKSEDAAIDESLAEEETAEQSKPLEFGKIEIPNLSKQVSKARRKNNKNLPGPITELPVFVSRPPAKFAAYLGQTLELKALARPGRAEAVHYIWVLNSKVVCTGSTCLLPLDGQTVDVGATQLTVVAFHTGGSVSSNHVLQVVQGQWKKGQVLNRRFLKQIDAIPDEGSVGEFDPHQDQIYALNGAGVHAYPGYFKVIGDAAQNFAWKGWLRTNSVGVVKIAVKEQMEWYMLRRSTLRFVNKESAGQRAVFVEEGGMRIRTERSREDASQEEAKPDLALENMSLETEEARVVVSEGADVFLVRSKSSASKDRDSKETRASTRVVVISGTAQVRLKIYQEGQANAYNLPTGLELLIFDDGEVAPLRKPDTQRMERLLQMTISPAEIAEEMARRNAVAAQAMDLTEVIKRVEGHMATEDYFEVLSAIAPVLSRLQENVKLGYYYGVANKGLYQMAEAETYLNGAYELDPSFYLAAWELALIKMEQKQWKESRLWLDRAFEHISSADPKYHEYYYYAGVIAFQTGQDFSARSDFTRALWGKGLESSLQGSAAGFLKTLIERKGWGLVAPFGVQYDANVLSLTQAEPVPEPFPGRGLFRSIAGLIFSADKSAQAEAPGTFLGYGAKAMSINNFPRGFSSLDVFIADVSLSQSFVSFEKVPVDPSKPDGEKNDEKKTTKLIQTLGLTVLNSTVSTVTLTLGLNWLEYEFTVAYDAAVAAGAFGKDDSVTMSQAANFPIATFGSASVALPVSFKQSYPFTTDASTGLGFTLGVGPVYSQLFSPRLSGNLGIKVEPNYVLAKPAEVFTLTAATSLGLTYFVTPWFLALPGVSFDAIWNDQKNGMVLKLSLIHI